MSPLMQLRVIEISSSILQSKWVAKYSSLFTYKITSSVRLRLLRCLVILLYFVWLSLAANASL